MPLLCMNCFSLKVHYSSHISLFRDQMLPYYCHLFTSLEELSDYIANGSYQFMSRVRVGYNMIKKPKQRSKSPRSKQNGGGGGGGSHHKPLLITFDNLILLFYTSYYLEHVDT